MREKNQSMWMLILMIGNTRLIIALRQGFILNYLRIVVFQFTRISPNQTTLMYTISGVLGGILSLNNNTSALIACLIFYFKGTIDWTDGLLARIKNETSSMGHILDTWGSHVGYIFISGLFIYCSNIDNKIYIMTDFFNIKAIDFKSYLYQQSFYEILNNTQNIENNFLKKDQIKKEKKLYLYFFKSIYG